MKKMFFAVLMVALLVTSGVAMAQGWGRGPGNGPGMAAMVLWVRVPGDLL